MKKTLIGALALWVVTVSAFADNDAAVVKQILTMCELTSLTATDVVTMEDGRVVTLDLKNKDIAEDGIQFLPSEIGKLTGLKELVCSGNIIDSLPAALASCSLLQKIDCASNRITAIPSAIGALKHLTHLDLRHNRVVTIAPEIGQCKSLFFLQLTGNKITVLPKEVVTIASLQELYLKDNRLTTLPKAITKRKFQYIDFIGNKLCTMEPSLKTWITKVDKKYLSQQKCW